MKVRDLIAKLSELDQDLEVFVMDGVGDTHNEFDIEEYASDPWGKLPKVKGVRLEP